MFFETIAKFDTFQFFVGYLMYVRMLLKGILMELMGLFPGAPSKTQKCLA